MNRTIRRCTLIAVIGIVTVAHSTVFASPEPLLNDTSEIKLVAPPESCRATKFLAQVDGGDGYWQNPAGTSNTLGVFFPSAIFRGAAVCDKVEDGWEVGFIQGLTQFEFDIVFDSGTLSKRKLPVPIADTIRLSTGVFRSVVGRKGVLAGVDTPSEHEDQPRFTSPWTHSDGAAGKAAAIEGVAGRFAARVYLVLIHERTRRMAVLRQAAWQSAVSARCDSKLRTCHLATIPRSAFSPEPIDLSAFPRQILAEPVAIQTPMVEAWKPAITRSKSQ